MVAITGTVIHCLQTQGLQRKYFGILHIGKIALASEINYLLVKFFGDFLYLIE